MIDFGEFVENIKDFYSQGKKPVLISAILVVFFFAAAMIVSIQSFDDGKKTASVKELPPEPLNADQALLLPDGPSVPSTYTVSRGKKDNWSQEEAEQWFTIPDSAAVDMLEKSNDSIISDITGAAP